MVSKREAATAEPPELAEVVGRNIRAMLAVRQRFEHRKTLDEKIALKVTAFTGKMRFVYMQAGVVVVWVALNLHAVPFIAPWDPFPFTFLAVIASIEAIFLATLVLVGENRMQQLADRRADLDLQVNLLAEREITRVLAAVDAIARHVGARIPAAPDLDALKRDVAPERVLEEIELAEKEASDPSSVGDRPGSEGPPRRP